MVTTLQLISIQHELGMAIGLDLRLEPMLQQFTRVCMRRLGLAGVHYFLLHDQTLALVLPDCDGADLGHVLSVPSCDSGCFSAVDALGLWLQLQASDAKLPCSEQQWDGQFYYCFDLGDLGCVVLHRLEQAIEPVVLGLLKPIFSRLAISCFASIEHEQLLSAVAARRQAEEKMVHQLYHDDLTQLANRRLAIQRLEQQIVVHRQDGGCGAVLFIDFDRFKSINDTLGHAVGDQLLISIGLHLQGQVGVKDTVARLSGDEFVILVSDLGKDRQEAARLARTLAERVRDVFEEPVDTGEHRLLVSPSIGTVVYPEPGQDAEAILRNADAAVYQAKAQGGNAVVPYSRRMSAALETRLAIEKALREAVHANDQFELHYQPQYSYAGKVTGAEALLRWTSPRLGQVSPSLFIPIAEETGLMPAIGDWVLVATCRDLGMLEGRGLPHTFGKLSFNVSPVQFENINFASDVLRAVRDAAIDPRRLGIEITESTLVENVDEAARKMVTLRNNGIHLSIDDFGTGYSSLAYLSRFPIGTLKIDQTFVRNIHTDRGNQAIVETIMALGRSFGFSTIAEGVETEEELECLNASGCESYQGYFFNRPMPLEQLSMLLGGNPSLHGPVPSTRRASRAKITLQPLR